MVDVCYGGLSIKCSILVTACISILRDRDIGPSPNVSLSAPSIPPIFFGGQLYMGLNVPYSQFYKTPKLYSRFVTSLIDINEFNSLSKR